MKYYFISCRCQNQAKNRAVQTMKDFVLLFDQMVINEDQLPGLIACFELNRKDYNRAFKQCGEMTGRWSPLDSRSFSRTPMYDFCECYCVSFLEVNQTVLSIGKSQILEFDPACGVQLSLF